MKTPKNKSPKHWAMHRLTNTKAKAQRTTNKQSGALIEITKFKTAMYRDDRGQTAYAKVQDTCPKMLSSHSGLIQKVFPELNKVKSLVGNSLT